MRNDSPRRVMVLLVMGVAALGVPFTAHSLVLDLTTTGSSGFINGAFFEQINPGTTGTGVIDSFVQISANSDWEHAYNTTVNNVLDNGSSDQFNHLISLSDIPLVNIGGTNYRQFLLDINEPNSNPTVALLTLTDLQIFQTPSSVNQSVETFTGGVIDIVGSLRYRLDWNADSQIDLNYALNTGSGSGDMFAYIPDSVFDPQFGSNIYLYSHFGGDNVAGIYANDSGFEEWAVIRDGVVPEPASLTLLGVGILGLIASKRKRA